MMFICLGNWTEQGVRTAKDIVKRRDGVKNLAEKLGGRLVSGYVTTGKYDVILTVEMPNGEAMAKFVLALSQAGNVRTTTVRAFSAEEFAKIAAEAPKM
jgi:uncharacterized protein with GYD domain